MMTCFPGTIQTSRYFVKKLYYLQVGVLASFLNRPVGSKGAPFSLFDCVKLTRRSPATPIIYLPLSHSHSIFPHPHQKSLAYQLPTPPTTAEACFVSRLITVVSDLYYLLFNSSIPPFSFLCFRVFILFIDPNQIHFIIQSQSKSKNASNP